ncbi:MAG: DNA-3-methyladenine glycosylase 2 [Clostridiales bacterium]|nr:DNA-3-methyladenine glycosylase 2 [Clostridiales bacterium]
MYRVENNKIIIEKLNNFNIVHILECGQIFRYKKVENDYIVFSKSEKAIVKTYRDKVEITCTNVDYFIKFFDLETNYTNIKQKLGQFDELKPILDICYGVRILKQWDYEMIISFIISSNNNIKRIQMIIENICKKFGKNMGEYFAFPTLKELENASIEDFKLCGAGYRAKYLVNVIKQLKDFNYNEIYSLSSEKAIDKILSLSGVGPKVADCILLFGFNKNDVFPVDTWIKKVYNSYFTKEKTDNVKEIRKNLVKMFGDLSGYAQQYLFYYKRSFEKYILN